MLDIELNSFIKELNLSISLFKPEFVLVITFLAALIFDLIFRKSRNITAYIAIIGLIITGIFLYMQTGAKSFTFAQSLVVDPMGQFFKFIILISSFIIVLISFFSGELYPEKMLVPQMQESKRSLGEYYTLIMGMTFGMFLLSEAMNLIMVYLALETMSISSYILAGYTKEIKRASEASLKYVIFGAVSSGMMIYGISILYGLTGSLNLTEINQYISMNHVSTFPLLISGLLIIAGIGYKISAVPFHFWTPDVYEGAPITITAYLSVASKAAGFALLIRFLKAGFIDPESMFGLSSAWHLLGQVDWKFIIAILSVLTMTLGNLVAIWQTNLKRLLAYSSIAHAGYMLMGVVVMTDAGVLSVMIYFLVYLFMNLGAFYIVMLLSNKIGSEELEDYSGIGYKAPTISVCMVIFLISLTGLPPTAGFIGKLYVFKAVLESNYIWLAVIGVLNSVVSLYYYVKIFRNMFIRGVDEGETAKTFEFSAPSIIVLFIFVIPTLLFGIYYTPIVTWAEASIKVFLGA